MVTAASNEFCQVLKSLWSKFQRFVNFVLTLSNDQLLSWKTILSRLQLINSTGLRFEPPTLLFCIIFKAHLNLPYSLMITVSLVWYLVFLYDCVKCSLENVSVNSLCSDGLPLWREFSFVFLTVQTHSGKDQLVLFGATECSAFLCVIAISRPSWHRQPSNGEQGAGEELGRMRGSSGFASAQVNPLIGSKGRRVARLCWPPGGAV